MHSITNGPVRYTLLGLVAIVLLACAYTIMAQPEKSQKLAHQLAGDESEQRDAVERALADRRGTIDELLFIIDPSRLRDQPVGARRAASYLLGKMRAPEAVPFLVANLAHDSGPQRRFDLDRYGDATFTALVAIGRPAVPTLIEQLESTNDAALRQRSLDVLYHVLGGKRHLLELLGKLEKRAQTDAIRERVKAALAHVEKHYVETEEPLY